MAITIGTNTTSLIAQMHLNSAADTLSQSMERLSSGLKINRAGDDAAGLVISENMEAKIRSSQQALNNIQTAESFLTVAEDGMVSISDHMQRINDLLTNMANDTNDTSSRQASVNEVIERLDEINRLADSTSFNGRAMLDGTTKSIVVQMGSEPDETSIIDIASALTDCHTYKEGTTSEGEDTTGLDIELPDELNPKAYEASDSTVYYLQDDGEYLDKDGNKYTGSVDDLTCMFDPTNANCRAYMAKIQSAIGIISEKRGLLGAYENRMDSSENSLTTRIEALEEGKVVYTDTDISSESTTYSKAQILEQINVSMLTSANSMQQVALSLLGG